MATTAGSMVATVGLIYCDAVAMARLFEDCYLVSETWAMRFVCGVFALVVIVSAGGD